MNTKLQVFENKALSTLQAIADLEKTKKELEVQEKTLRQKLEEVMEENGVKGFENNFISLQYIEPTTSIALDTKALKQDKGLWDMLPKKTTERKGYVKIKVLK